MKKYELEMQIQKQMEELQNQKAEDRKTVEQLCSEWNWTLSDKEATIVNNQIVINKGKVIEITKEDNSTIEMLRETIRQMNQNMNDMQKQHEEEITKLKEQYEQQMLDMTSEFEYEYECAINKREEQIKELEEKLDFKELLLSEFRDNMDEKIETIHKLENEIEGMRFGYENKIAKLKEEANKPRIKIEVVDDPDFNDEPQEKPVVKEQPKTNKPNHKQIDMVLYDVHLTHDGCVRGYTKEYEFVWNKNSNVPAYKPNNSKKWMPMTKAKYAEALYIKEQLAHFFEQDKATKDITIKQPKEEKVIEEVPEIVVNVTNDQVEQQIEEEDPLAGADEMEFW